MTDFAPTRAHAPSRRSRHLAKAPLGVPASAALLTGLIRSLAARHADEPEVVAVCEKWGRRVAALQREMQMLEPV